MALSMESIAKSYKRHEELKRNKRLPTTITVHKHTGQRTRSGFLCLEVHYLDCDDELGKFVIQETGLTDENGNTIFLFNGDPVSTITGLLEHIVRP